MLAERSDPIFTSYTVIGILLSVILHVLTLPILFSASKPSINEEFIATVSFVPPPRVEREIAPEPKRQIVTPPEASEPVKETKPTKYLSEKDTFTAKEQIRRGDNGGAVGRSQQKTVMQPKPETKPQSPPKEVSLKLDQGTLLSKFASKKEPVKNTSSEPFSRPSGSGAQFIGLGGSSDFLPNLPDGDITLLNAKADKFAVFVRRVATQVFAAMRANGLELLSIPDLQSAREMNTVRAVLSPSGDLIKVTIESESGSSRFDEVLLGAVKKGAKDKNPPKDAAGPDGNYYFVFKSQSWARNEVSKTGAHFRRMWLLLATGLE